MKQKNRARPIKTSQAVQQANHKVIMIIFLYNLKQPKYLHTNVNEARDSCQS